MRRLPLLLVLVVAAVLAACGDDEPAPAGDDDGGQLGLFDWNRDPDTIVVRLDSRLDEDDPAPMLNEMPPCTVWGDGRVVWVTRNELGGEDVLEARVDEATLRAFIEAIINRGFYTWEDELLPPASGNPQVQTVTLALYDEVRTVRRYSTWPQNAFQNTLDECRSLSDSPVLVRPDAGWVSAYPIPRDSNLPTWFWPPSAPFTLAELAESGEARWLEGDLAAMLWQNIREGSPETQVLERDGQSYQVALVVPDYSRDASPPPDAAAGS